MPISVGVAIHEGEKFSSTMRLIESSFRSCVVLVDDSIQAHTLQIEEPDTNLDDLRNRAISDGDLWLKRNKDSYAGLTIPCSVTRWEDWRKHAHFLQYLECIKELCDSDREYRNAIYLAIDDFLGRYVMHRVCDNELDMPHTMECCLHYLQEECAVMCLWAAEKFDFEVYPSGRNQAMLATYEKLIKPVYPNLLKSVSLYFEKRSKN